MSRPPFGPLDRGKLMLGFAGIGSLGYRRRGSLSLG